MTTYEYQTLKIREEQFDAAMNEAGAEGWEAVSIERVASNKAPHNPLFRVVLKKTLAKAGRPPKARKENSEA